MKLNELHAIYAKCKNCCFFFICNTLFCLFFPATCCRWAQTQNWRTTVPRSRLTSSSQTTWSCWSSSGCWQSTTESFRPRVSGMVHPTPPFSYLTAHAGKGKGSQPTSVFRTVEAWLKWSRADREALSLCWWTAFRGQSFLLTARSFYF